MRTALWLDLNQKLKALARTDFLIPIQLEVLLSEFQQTHSGTAAVVELLPTQLTVGLREVEFKRKTWRARDRDDAARYLATHSVPVVLGPGARLSIVDRHHLTRALHDEGVANVPICVIANLSHLSNNEFWRILEDRRWTHPFDDEGVRCAYNVLPKFVGDLVDDPFRSLASALKRAGGYKKDKSPFSEFRWADFLRARIERRMVEFDFSGALALAMSFARSRDAGALPGWSAPDSEYRRPQQLHCENR